MKILAIGNSFSADVTRYLHEIAEAGGFILKVVNLYIGGCSLATHYKNINNDDRAYSLEFNGYETGFFVSIREALQSDLWDYVTMQQASLFSNDHKTYQPYLQSLSEYVKFHAPQAAQVFHRTWAYENGSQRLADLGYSASSEMLADINAASEKAANEAGINQIIPTGDLIESMTNAGVSPIYRDTYHLSFGAGRYAAAALWYEWFTGKTIMDNTFNKFDEDIDNKTISEIKQLVHRLADERKPKTKLSESS